MAVLASRAWRILIVTILITVAGGDVTAAGIEDKDVARHSETLMFGSGEDLRVSLAALRARGNPDAAAAMILALRFRRNANQELSDTLKQLTGHQALGWFDWMVWQEANPGIKPHPSFTQVKLDLFERLDPNFLRFFRSDWADPDKMKIRMAEITWGGVRVDGIPALDNPNMISAADSVDLLDDDLVFGVEINGDARAYPLRIMGWHEMFNEVIGGVPVALAYCTLAARAFCSKRWWKAVNSPSYSAHPACCIDPTS